MEKRNTKQYLLIYDLVHNNYCHPTAEDIHQQVVRVYPNVSLTTVYRNLNKLALEGKIKRIIIANQKDRFDTTVSNHYHLCCDKCHKFVDLDYPYQLELDQKVKEISNYEINSHSIIFNGICPECQKNKGE